MSNDDTEVLKRTYIINLSFMSYERRLVLVGDEKVSGTKYLEARLGVEEIGDACNDWNQFVSLVIEHFAKYGFYRVRE